MSWMFQHPQPSVWIIILVLKKAIYTKYIKRKEWTNKCLNELVKESMNDWINERIKEWMNARLFCSDLVLVRIYPNISISLYFILSSFYLLFLLCDPHSISMCQAVSAEFLFDNLADRQRPKRLFSSWFVVLLVMFSQQLLLEPRHF